MDQAIIPECYVDTNLIETLVPPHKQYNHQKGCGTVTKKMKENFSDRFAVGIIDKDKKQVDYLKEFNLVSQKDSLFLYKHVDRHHYIIQIYPAIERFILNCAGQAALRMESFGLSSDFSTLKKESKTVTSKNDKRFKDLFNSIKDMGSPQFDQLSNWIIYLKEANYDVDIEELKRI